MPWTLRGECNHCGYCCRFLGPIVLTMTWAADEEPDQAYWLLRGATITGKTVRYCCHSLLPCQVYDEPAKRCGTYETRPAICRTYPVRPEQIEGTPCSYWFENERGEQRGGGASPYPTPSRLR